LKAKTLKGFLAALGAAIMVMAVLVPSAMAETPKTGYTQFKGCPSMKEVASSEICVRNEVYGGHLQMGSKDVPIEKPIILVGGVNAEFGNFVANKEGGLLPSKQKVPGGVIGLTGLTWLLEFLGSEALTLYAETQGAGIPDVNPFEEPLTLPLKVHLINGVLGNNCYIGSVSNPITLNLIVGTTNPPPPNTPITGKAPKFSFNPTTNISKFSEGTFVDNSFAAPGASGCVLTLFGFIPISINGLVNQQSGLPSPAGHNATSQNVNIEAVESELVYP
jgi:hypothetical protein